MSKLIRNRRQARRSSLTVRGEALRRAALSRAVCGPNFEKLEDRTLFSVFTVSNTLDTGPGSLRQAIIDANTNANASGPDQIVFNITAPATNGVWTITPTSALPQVTDGVSIDATSQAGYAGVPLVELSGVAAGAGANGLDLAGSGDQVKGFVIDSFSGAGVMVESTADSAGISNNYIGTDTTGSFSAGNSDGLILNGDYAVVTENVLSGNNDSGITVNGDFARIQGNFVGTDASGAMSVSNLYGMVISGSNELVGGSSASRNVISGNIQDGVLFDNAMGGGSFVQGNYIGTDVTGQHELGNGGNGVNVQSSSDVQIGGVLVGQGNLISANFTNGVTITDSSDVVVAGNLIGTDVTGTMATDPNDTSFMSTIGNAGNGVYVSGASTNITIGWTTPGGLNVISNNSGDGVRIETTGPGLTAVEGNYIGTDVSGLAALGNDGNGVTVLEGAAMIGGSTSAAANVLSGNEESGVELGDGTYAQTGAIVQGNLVGVAADGVNPLANVGDGVSIWGANNTVTGNTLANNFGNGVGIYTFNGNPSDTTGNAIRGNVIYANGLLGIDLGGDGVTNNDASGHVGPNNFQNFPLFTQLKNIAGQVTVLGTLDAAANAMYTIDIYGNPAADPSGHGQGQVLLGTVVVTTDSTGHASFNQPLGMVAEGTVISATATDAAGNTSEFNADAAVPAAVFPAVTTTTLSSSLNPSIVGQTVTFTANVTAANSLAVAGMVSFMDGSTLLGSSAVDGSGAAMLSISTLTVGGHTITAVFTPTDPETMAGSTSLALSQQVNQVQTTMTLSSSLNPSIVTQNITLTANVSAAFGTAGGVVTFFDGSNVIGTANLDATGVATVNISTLTVGTHMLSAVYAGTTTFAGSTSNTISQQVNLAQTSTTLTSSMNPSTVGQMITLTADVTSAFGTAGGVVTFFDGGNVIGTATLDANGVGTLNISTLTVGDHELTAVYGGASPFAGSTSNTVSQQVILAETSTSLSSSANPSIAGQSITLTAVVTSVFGIPTGTITFMDGSTVLGTGTVDATGTATFSTSSLALGTHMITAMYGGDAKFDTSVSSPLAQQVNSVVVVMNTTTTSLTSSLDPSLVGQSVTLTATVGSNAGVPTGMVTFMEGSTTLGTGTLDANGVATLTLTALTAGEHDITAVYTGASTYMASVSPTLIQQVNLAQSSTTLSSSLNPSIVTQNVTFTATVTSVFGMPTGTVTFMDGNTALGTVSLNSSGMAMFSTTALTLGSHNVTAVYSGSSAVADSTSAVLVQQVNLAQSSTTLSSSINPSIVSQNVTLTANVTSVFGTPTGTVTFMDGNSVLGSATLNSSGVATMSISTLALGSHNLKAVYGGTTTFATSTSAVLVQQVNLASTSTTLTSSCNPSTVNQSVTLTATVASVFGTPTGTVTFTEGSTILGTVALNSSGKALLAISSLSVGTHNIVATYSGSGVYNVSSATLAQQVKAAATCTTLASSANPSISGQSITLTSNVTTTAGFTPTGTVKFMDGSTLLGTGTLDATGKATLSISTLSIGTHTLTAVYSGDAKSLTSTSSPLSQVVKAPPASLGGHVYTDLAGDGLTPDDTPESGVTVQLYVDTNNDGKLGSGDTLVTSQVTGADGSYNFTGLAAGKYLVNEVAPSNTVRTAPALTSYYFNAAAAGTVISTDDFANFVTCNCSSDISNVKFTLTDKYGHCTTVTDLRGHTLDGETITVTFTALAGCTDTFSLVSYTAPDATFNADDASQQAVYQAQTIQTHGAGTYTLTVKVPTTGHYQIDFVCGNVIYHFGPAGSNIFYTPQGRLISADNE